MLDLMLATLVCYGPPMLVGRGLELAVMRRVSLRKPEVGKFWMLHLASLGVVVVFTPALCYLLGGQVMRAIGYQSASLFNGSVDMWVTFWLVSLALPLQFHYVTNNRLTRISDEEGRPDPGWLVHLWTAVTLVTVTVAWLPYWFGWIGVRGFLGR